VTRPTENQQTVETLAAIVEQGMSSYVLAPDGTDRRKLARAALRDLVAQAELAAELGTELKRITEHKPVASLWRSQEDVDRVRALLAGLDGAR